VSYYRLKCNILTINTLNTLWFKKRFIFSAKFLTMTENKKTVTTYLEGFGSSDHDIILSCLTDDIFWEMPGMFRLRGKEAFNKEIENDFFEGSPVIEIIRMTEENDIVVAEGSVRCKIKSGGFLDAVFCDVFHMENTKIKRLITYQMNK
jgi:ketosteroid isomerase-like protein